MVRPMPICVVIAVLATSVALLPAAAAAGPEPAVPRLLGLSPGSGPVAAGNTLVVRGHRLDGVSAVSFGTATSRDITRLSKHRLGVVVPAHAAATVHVRLLAGQLTSAAGSTRSAYRFTERPPAVHFGHPQVIEPSNHTFLTDVSCAGPRWCMAVDYAGNALLWSHGHWSKAHKIDSHRLVAITCKPSHTCIAADNFRGRGDPTKGGRVVTYRGGRWGDPQQIDAGHRLADVSCARHVLCAAVDHGGRVIIKQTGHGWQAPKVINTLALTAIACPSQDTCVTTGYTNHARFDGIARVMRGTNWPVIVHSTRRGLHAVDCSSADNCLMLGDTGYLVWHGDTRSQLILPRHGGNESTEVTCAGPTFCVGTSVLFESEPDETGGMYAFDGAATRRLPGKPDGGVSCAMGSHGPVCVVVSAQSAVIGRT